MKVFGGFRGIFSKIPLRIETSRFLFCIRFTWKRSYHRNGAKGDENFNDHNENGYRRCGDAYP